jgi:hypothetical protein
MTTEHARTDSLLEALANLARSHSQHERFYASAPRETAVRLQRHARTLQALADRWTSVSPSDRRPLSPYEGAEDLNSTAAVQLDGVLFLEGDAPPAEIGHVVRELRADADDCTSTGEWLATAMEASWAMASALLDIDELADVLGERHRMISNDWLAAHASGLAGRLLARAAEMLEHVDFTPAALRRDLAGPRTSPARLYSAAELISRAADLCSESAGLVHDNERRWRVFRQRVDELARGTCGPEPGGDGGGPGRGDRDSGAAAPSGPQR